MVDLRTVDVSPFDGLDLTGLGVEPVADDEVDRAVLQPRGRHLAGDLALPDEFRVLRIGDVVAGDGVAVEDDDAVVADEHPPGAVDGLGDVAVAGRTGVDGDCRPRGTLLVLVVAVGSLVAPRQRVVEPAVDGLHDVRLVDTPLLDVGLAVADVVPAGAAGPVAAGLCRFHLDAGVGASGRHRGRAPGPGVARVGHRLAGVEREVTAARLSTGGVDVRPELPVGVGGDESEGTVRRFRFWARWLVLGGRGGRVAWTVRREQHRPAEARAQQERDEHWCSESHTPPFDAPS